jgi:hypothetical protein
MTFRGGSQPLDLVEGAWASFLGGQHRSALLGGEFGRGLPPDPTPEQAWAYVNELWEGDPGGRGWQVRVPRSAAWLSLRDDEGDPARGGGPEPAFGFGEPPVGEGTWEEPGH